MLELLLIIFVALFLTFAGLEQFGRRFRLRRSGNKPAHPEEADSISYVLTSIFGLLGLLIGFTFSMALSRYEVRRADVVAESNAIGTAYFRASFVSGTERADLRKALKDYAALRLEYGKADSTGRPELVRRSEEMRGVIAAAAERAIAKLGNSPMATTLAASINETIDSGPLRESNIDARIPSIVIFVLLSSCCVSAFMIGYARTDSSRARMIANQLLFLLLSMALIMIFDLDRPARGSVVISQQSMIDLVNSLGREEETVPAVPGA